MKFDSKGNKLYRGNSPVPMATKLLDITRDSATKFHIIKNYAFYRALEAAGSITKDHQIEYLSQS